jgi:hypothetical protein
MTYCKVKEVSPGILLFEGDGFNLNMTYNPKLISPKIEFYEVNPSCSISVKIREILA